MLAQASADVAKGFIEQLPEILRAAATNPLGLVALIVLALSVLAYFLFKNSRDKTKLIVLCVIVGCVFVLAVLVVHKAATLTDGSDRAGKNHATNDETSPGTRGTATAAPCKVGGFVYNLDVEPSRGMPDVRLAYLPSVPTNSPAVPITTTSPNGRFSFDCSHIQPDQFPIHLQMTYSWPSGSQIVQSEDRVFVAGNSEMNLYLSPRQITNWHLVNRTVLRVSSAQLLRNNFTTLTATGRTARLPTSGVVAVPPRVAFPRGVVVGPPGGVRPNR